MSAAATFTFAVYPSDFGDSFDGYLMDVPTTGGQQVAARRAYFAAMAQLAGHGIDVDGFHVCCWINDKPGPLVGPGGLEVQS
jgi:hypothetical protein